MNSVALNDLILDTSPSTYGDMN